MHFETCRLTLIFKRFPQKRKSSCRFSRVKCHRFSGSLVAKCSTISEPGVFLLRDITTHRQFLAKVELRIPSSLYPTWCFAKLLLNLQQMASSLHKFHVNTLASSLLQRFSNLSQLLFIFQRSLAKELFLTFDRQQVVVR